MKRSAPQWIAFAALGLLVSGCGDEASPGVDAAGVTPDAGIDAGPSALDRGMAIVDAADVIDAAAPDAAGPDQTESAFRPDRLLEIRIEMRPAEWDALRLQTRNVLDILGPGCLESPRTSPFTYFEADVEIDGERIEGIGARKKGLLGSMSDVKPSLKLKLDEYIDGQRWSGLRRLTLNNNNQDPSLIKQCLGYSVLRAAGLPAARCSFANVWVNGTNLGVYTHLESMKKPFLRRHFADPEGNFYEGTLSDFRPAWIQTFQRKTNQSDPDRADLEAVRRAAEAPDAELVERLEAVVALDGFFTLWAAEVILQHGDGYSGNTNNFYIYGDPVSGRFHFIPWGIDGIMYAPPPGERARAVMTVGVLAHRLYRLPATRERYLARLRGLLEEVWDASALLAEIDRMEALITPAAVEAGAERLWEQIEAVRVFVRGRKAALLAQLDPPPEAPGALRGSPCFEEVGRLSATFSTTWGSYPGQDPMLAGESSLTASWPGGAAGPDLPGGALAGDPSGEAELLLIAPMGGLGAGRALAVQVVTRVSAIEPGVLPIDWSITRAVLFVLYPGQEGREPDILGWVGRGEVVLERAGTAPGDPIVGRIEAPILGGGLFGK